MPTSFAALSLQQYWQQSHQLEAVRSRLQEHNLSSSVLSMSEIQITRTTFKPCATTLNKQSRTTGVRWRNHWILPQGQRGLFPFHKLKKYYPSRNQWLLQILTINFSTMRHVSSFLLISISTLKRCPGLWHSERGWGQIQTKKLSNG